MLEQVVLLNELDDEVIDGVRISGVETRSRAATARRAKRFRRNPALTILPGSFTPPAPPAVPRA